MEFFFQDFIKYDPQRRRVGKWIGGVPRDVGLGRICSVGMLRKITLSSTVVSPSTYVSASALPAKGVELTARNYPGGSNRWENCIVNSGAIIEHDCVM